MDRLTVRTPSTRDLAEALKDLVTLRSAPPLVVSAAAIVLLTGSILIAVLTASLTAFTHALWSRLLADEGRPS